MERRATAVWQGDLRHGQGTLTTESKVLSNTPYSFSTRFEGSPGTNPEELLGAAHAGCFTMKLSFVLNESGFTADNLKTRCEITFENGSITKSHLTVEGKVPGIDDKKFQEAVKNAEQNCPISKLLKTTITSEGKLVR